MQNSTGERRARSPGRGMATVTRCGTGADGDVGVPGRTRGTRVPTGDGALFLEFEGERTWGLFGGRSEGFERGAGGLADEDAGTCRDGFRGYTLATDEPSGTSSPRGGMVEENLRRLVGCGRWDDDLVGVI